MEKNREYWHPEVKKKQKKALGFFLAFLSSLGLVFFPGKASEPFSVTAEASSPYMKITCIDLGGSSEVYGESILLESGGQYLLMDTGSMDPNKTVIRYLRKRGVRNLSLYISHFHEDHCYYAASILRDSNFHVKRVYLANPDPARRYLNSSTRSHRKKLYDGCRQYLDYYNSIRSAARSRRVPVTDLRKGKSFAIGSVRANVLWDHNPRGFSSFDPYDKGGVGFINNSSLVTRFSLGKRSFLNCGDIEFSTERDLLASGMNLSADILKLNHHGIWTSNLNAFVKAVNPCYCFYSYKNASDQEHRRFASAPDVSSVLKRLSSKYNILGNRYNGTITYKIQSNTIYVSAARHTKTRKVRVVKKSDGKTHIWKVVYNDAQALYLDKRMLPPGTSPSTDKLVDRTRGYVGWKKDSRGWRYITSKGIWLSGGWKTLGKQVYYFNNSGYRHEGWLTLNGKKYFMSRLGIRQTGWQMIDGKFYYFSTYPGKVGTMMTGRIKVGNSWWPLRSDGTLDLSKKKAPNINITTSEHRHTTK